MSAEPMSPERLAQIRRIIANSYGCPVLAVAAECTPPAALSGEHPEPAGRQVDEQ